MQLRLILLEVGWVFGAVLLEFDWFLAAAEMTVINVRMRFFFVPPVGHKFKRGEISTPKSPYGYIFV